MNYRRHLAYIQAKITTTYKTIVPGYPGVPFLVSEWHSRSRQIAKGMAVNFLDIIKNKFNVIVFFFWFSNESGLVRKISFQNGNANIFHAALSEWTWAFKFHWKANVFITDCSAKHYFKYNIKGILYVLNEYVASIWHKFKTTVQHIWIIVIIVEINGINGCVVGGLVNSSRPQATDGPLQRITWILISWWF